ncbi:hypothetical protein BROUX41_000765 [Berkeleyomyces rouxiae]|uniref:uncharacterized protein n=1 Tax=Berkeleyomyces rouxiae TaxID=2035830 RepID=UPI003B7601DE
MLSALAAPFVPLSAVSDGSPRTAELAGFMLSALAAPFVPYSAVHGDLPHTVESAATTPSALGDPFIPPSGVNGGSPRTIESVTTSPSVSDAPVVPYSAVYGGPPRTVESAALAGAQLKSSQDDESFSTGEIITFGQFFKLHDSGKLSHQNITAGYRAVEIRLREILEAIRHGQQFIPILHPHFNESDDFCELTRYYIDPSISAYDQLHDCPIGFIHHKITNGIFTGSRENPEENIAPCNDQAVAPGNLVDSDHDDAMNSPEGLSSNFFDLDLPENKHDILVALLELLS